MALRQPELDARIEQGQEISDFASLEVLVTLFHDVNVVHSCSL
jgi:hypothetical protein